MAVHGRNVNPTNQERIPKTKEPKTDQRVLQNTTAQHPRTRSTQQKEEGPTNHQVLQSQTEVNPPAIEIVKKEATTSSIIHDRYKTTTTTTKQTKQKTLQKRRKTKQTHQTQQN